jgi:hypothetical protein
MAGIFFFFSFWCWGWNPGPHTGKCSNPELYSQLLKVMAPSTFTMSQDLCLSGCLLLSSSRPGVGGVLQILPQAQVEF